MEELRLPLSGQPTLFRRFPPCEDSARCRSLDAVEKFMRAPVPEVKTLGTFFYEAHVFFQCWQKTMESCCCTAPCWNRS